MFYHNSFSVNLLMINILASVLFTIINTDLTHDYDRQNPFIVHLLKHKKRL